MLLFPKIYEVLGRKEGIILPSPLRAENTLAGRNDLSPLNCGVV